MRASDCLRPPRGASESGCCRLETTFAHTRHSGRAMNASKPSAVWSVSTVSGPGARRSLLSLLGVAGACGLALLAGCAAPGAGSVRRLETGDDGLPDPDPQGSLSEAQARCEAKALALLRPINDGGVRLVGGHPAGSSVSMP